MHLEGATGWTNTTELFKALKTAKEPLEGSKLEELIDEVSDNPKNEFNKEQFELQTRNKELVRYAFPKLSNKLKVLCCNTKASMNGLEVLRLAIREHDPIGENISTGLEQRFTTKLKHKCKTLEASREIVKELEKAITEYGERAGKELNPRLQATVLLGTMDEDTAVAIEAKGIDTSSFKEMRQFAEQRYINQQARKVGIGERPHKDLSAVGGEGDEALTETWASYEYDLSALLKGKGKKGGKGKGKNGGSKGSQECYRCRGIGHIARECPTPEGSEDTHVCLSCGGCGQYARDHGEVPKGKGKGDPWNNAWKGKGKGKEGYKGVHWQRPG